MPVVFIFCFVKGLFKQGSTSIGRGVTGLGIVVRSTAQRLLFYLHSSNTLKKIWQKQSLFHPAVYLIIKRRFKKEEEVVSDKTINSMKEYDHYIWQTSKGTCLHHSSKLTVPRQAGAAGAADTNREDDDADDEDYNPNEKANWIAADSVSQQSEELWWISQTNTKHVCHRNLVAVERLAPLNHEQNVRLGIVMLAFDYSENGMMKDINQVESQYWVTIQQTKPIASETQTKDWNKQGGRNEL